MTTLLIERAFKHQRLTTLTISSGLFYLFASLALALTRDGQNIALLWMANISVAYYLSTQDAKYWSTALLGVAIANLAADYPYSSSILQSLSFLPANLIEITITAHVLKHHVSIDQVFKKPFALLKVFYLVCFLTPITGALSGTLLHYTYSQQLSWSFTLNWWLSSVIGCFALLPLCLLVSQRGLTTTLESFLKPWVLALLIAGGVIIYHSLIHLAFPYIYISTAYFVIAVISLSAAVYMAFFATIFVTLMLNIGALIPTDPILKFAEFATALFYLPHLLSLIPLLALAFAVYSNKKNQAQLISQQQQSKELYRKTPVAMYTLDQYGDIVDVSDQWLNLLGYQRKDVLGKASVDFMMPNSKELALNTHMPQLYRRGTVHELDYQFRHANGEPINVLFSAVIKEEHLQMRAYVVLSDISREKHLDQQAQQREQFLQLTLSSVGDAIVATDTEGKVTYVNPKARSLLDLCQSTQPLHSPADDIIKLYDLDGVQTPTSVNQVLSCHELFQREQKLKLHSPSQGEMIIKERAYPIMDKKQFQGVVLVYQDITKEHHLQEEMCYIAKHDELTGLPNRTVLVKRLTELCHNPEPDKNFVLLYLDLDNFKNINDCRGHSEGDRVLKVLSERIETFLSPQDEVYRFGGDEFVVLLNNNYQAMKLKRECQTLLDEINLPLTIHKTQHSLSASVGIVSFPRDGQDPDTLLRRADVAMYQAKSQGKNTFSFYTKGLTEHIEQRLEIEQRLKRAIELNRLEVHYQPIFNTKTNQTTHAEALCRWPSDDTDKLFPDQFIPVAEESTLIHQLGMLVLNKTCENETLFRQYQAISINISAIQMELPHFMDDIKTTLQRNKIPPSRLIFEITETSIMKNPENSQKVLAELRAMGSQIAVDDFGTGYSSLSYLKRYPVDYLKIDRDFINDLTRSKSDHAFVMAIISLAKALDLKVIAEGVETQEQQDELSQAGCEYLQGYHLGKPEPVEMESNMLYFSSVSH
ncbi:MULTISPECIES: EAL domain-containing protein [unclassified Vibrio]|uniref:EAL domain-containing protein n=1 Tax=Vibrio sp. HB236076 TaxID=3232307 RepID=A0AB39HFV1_9VIBR|nr:EAL domain-containing protein [Vibrio sp. HB161653]MDP5255237.1 EAL domain-containing protein [Vibrio sp. HB161653]